MTIPIKTSYKDFFKILLVVLYPVMKLTNKELDIMSLLMRAHHINKEKIGEEETNRLLLSSSTRKLIRKNLTISESSFNNYLGQLKRKGLIQDNTINKNLYQFYPDNKGIEINYNIQINEQIES